MGVVHQRLRGPLLQRQRSTDIHSAQHDRNQQKPAGTTGVTTGGGTVSGSGTLTNVSMATSTCSPVGKKRFDFLKEPHATTKDFGLTRLHATAFPEFRTGSVHGGFVIEPTAAVLPVIQSVFTDADVFTEGEAHFIAQDDGECLSGKKPIRWIITSGGASKIKQGEQEHCNDYQLAFDLSLKRYAAAVNTLAGRQTYASQDAAKRAVTQITGVAPGEWVGVFSCLAHKTELRDGDGPSGWHTPRPMTRPPRLDTNCDHVTELVQASSLPEVGQHPSAEIIKDCGETGKKLGSAAATRSVHARIKKLRSMDVDKRAQIQCKSTVEAAASSRTVPVADVLGAPGHTLGESVRGFMEPRFGFDFSRVRVHTDPAAARLAEMLDALAYTVGPHVVFAPGRYEPHTSAGLRLLAHELAHVVQQSTGSTVGRENLEISPPSDAAEQEADVAAARVVANARSGELSARTGPVLQRQTPDDDAGKKPAEKEDAGEVLVGGLKTVVEQAKDNNPNVKQIVIDPIKDRLKGEWARLSTGEKAATIGVGAAALGTAGGTLLSDPGGRKQLAGVNLAAPFTLIPYMPLSSFKYALPSGNTPDTRLLKFDTTFNADDLINLHTAAHGLPKMSLTVDMQWGYDPTTERLSILGGDAKLGLVPGLSISAGAYKDIFRPPQTTLGPEGQTNVIKQSIPGGPKAQPIPDVRVMVTVDLLKFKPGDLARQVKGFFGR